MQRRIPGLHEQKAESNVNMEELGHVQVGVRKGELASGGVGSWVWGAGCRVNG